MRLSLAPPHFCQFPGCRRLSRATPMALHSDGTDHPRIAWVCAKHSLLFYAGAREVVAWVQESAESRITDGTAPMASEAV